jgi:hypothetical protein
MNFPPLLKQGLVLFILMLSSSAYAQFTFTTNSDGSLNISASTASGALVIPDTFDNVPITTIGNNAFNHTFISSVAMGTNIVSIGFGAFSTCSQLKTVTFGSNLGSIGNSAFANDPLLKAVVVPDSVTNFGSGVFFQCNKLYSATLGNQLVSLPDYTFQYCTNLTNIVIGSALTNIGVGVFTYNPLVAIFVNPANQFFCSSNGVLFDKNQTTLVLYPNQQTAGTYVIPDSVRLIGHSAFYACSSLTNMVIPNNVTNIEFSAFAASSALASVAFGSSVAKIEDDAFQGCGALASVVLPDSLGFELHIVFLFQRFQLTCEFGIGSQYLSQFHKCAHDHDAGLRGLIAVQQVRQHQRAMLGKGVRQMGREFKSCEVVTICDHLQFLGFRQLKHEVGREAGFIAFNGLVQRFGANAVKGSQIQIQHDFLTPDQQDCPFDSFCRNQAVVFAHVLRVVTNCDRLVLIFRSRQLLLKIHNLLNLDEEPLVNFG